MWFNEIKIKHLTLYLDSTSTEFGEKYRLYILNHPFCLPSQQKFQTIHFFSNTIKWHRKKSWYTPIGGKNACFDQPSPEQADHLILLIENKVKWSTKTGGRWSDDPFCPISCQSKYKPMNSQINVNLEKYKIIKYN